MPEVAVKVLAGTFNALKMTTDIKTSFEIQGEATSYFVNNIGLIKEEITLDIKGQKYRTTLEMLKYKLQNTGQ